MRDESDFEIDHHLLEGSFQMLTINFWSSVWGSWVGGTFAKKIGEHQRPRDLPVQSTFVKCGQPVRAQFPIVQEFPDRHVESIRAISSC